MLCNPEKLENYISRNPQVSKHFQTAHQPSMDVQTCSIIGNSIQHKGRMESTIIDIVHNGSPYFLQVFNL